MIVLLFFLPANWLGRLTAFWTGKPYSHAGIALDVPSLLPLQYWEAVSSGVATDLGADAQASLDQAALKVALPLAPDKVVSVHDWLQAHVDQPYEVLGVVTLGLAILTRRHVEADVPGQQFCSELACSAAQIAGYFEAVEPADTDPGDLAALAVSVAPLVSGHVLAKLPTGGWQEITPAAPLAQVGGKA